MGQNLEQKVDEILFYLKSDSSMGHVGLVEQQGINTKEISDIKTEKKITAAKIGIAATVLTFVGGLLLKLIGIIKFVV